MRVWLSRVSQCKRRVLRDRGQPAGCLEAPGSRTASDGAPGRVRGQQAQPRLCLRGLAPGVLRLCVTLAGVHAGLEGGGGKGNGGRDSFLRCRPRPPAY